MQRKEITIARGRQFRVEENGLLWGMAAIKLALYILSGNLYAYQPQEYYAISCSYHLDWGFAEFPPFSIFLLWLVRHTIGISLFALHLLPALAGVLTVYFTGKLVKDLGGSTFAVSLACSGMILTPLYLAQNNVFSTLAFSVLFGVLAMVILLQILESGQRIYWLLLGLVLGAAILTHYSAIPLILGIYLGLLLTPHREHYWYKETWFSLVLIFCFLFPHLVWQFDHHWPALQTFGHHLFWRHSDITPITFIRTQLFSSHPVILLICLTGAIVLMADKSIRDYRIMFYIFITGFILLFLTGVDDGRSMFVVYPFVLVPGTLYIEQKLVENSPMVWKPVIMFPLYIIGLAILPLCLSVLPVRGLDSYLEKLNFYEIGLQRIYQHPYLDNYAGQLQTRSWITQSAEYYRNIAGTNTVPLVLLSDNKYLAGAMDFYRRNFHQQVISPDGSWWLWGPGAREGQSLFYVNDQAPTVYWYDLYQTVTPVDTLELNGPFGMDRSIYLYHLQDPKQKLPESWDVLKKY